MRAVGSVAVREAAHNGVWMLGGAPRSPTPLRCPYGGPRSRSIIACAAGSRRQRHQTSIEVALSMTDSARQDRSSDPARAEVLRKIHDAHGPAVLRYVLRLTRGDREFSEDVVQESLLRLWNNPTLLTTGSEESIRAWLHTVARNLVIDDRRSSRHQRELQTENLPERDAPDLFGPAVDKWVVTDALRALSPEHRAVLVRAHYLGQTAVQIATAEGIPAGTVKSRLHYALRELRRTLEERGIIR